MSANTRDDEPQERRLSFSQIKNSRPETLDVLGNALISAADKLRATSELLQRSDNAGTSATDRAEASALADEISADRDQLLQAVDAVRLGMVGFRSGQAFAEAGWRAIDELERAESVLRALAVPPAFRN